MNDGPASDHRPPDIQTIPTRSGSLTWEDTQRARSHPRSLRLLFGAAMCMAFWLSILGTMASLFLILSGKPGPWQRVVVGCLVSTAVTLVIMLGITLTEKCPLCHGTPLHERRCHKHRLAQRLPFFTYRFTAVLAILFTMGFRCMYCGTPFRLFKKSSRQR